MIPEQVFYFNVDTTFDTQRIISYCTGTRGLERGLQRVGFPMQTIAFLEIEAFIVGNLVAQMEAGLLAPAPVWTNIKTFDARPFRNKIHGIVGGYPCQPFSHAGERKGVDDERHLWPYIFKQIEIIRPQWVYFENVAGHISLGYEEVRRSLSGLGYRVEEGIFTAEEVGAPHRRERLFIFGVMENAGILGWRGRSIGDKRGNKCEIQVEGSGTTLENTNSHRIQREQQRGVQSDNNGASKAMASTSNSGQQVAGPAGEWQLSEEKGKGMDYRLKLCCNTVEHSDGGSKQHISRKDIEATEQRQFRNAGGQLDNAVIPGVSFQSRDDGGKRGWQNAERSTSEASLFPAGQGTYQHEWEESRTIESSLEYTIDGYNFTEDLHRAIGNSVVEQVAELAFIYLLNKHNKNILP